MKRRYVLSFLGIAGGASAVGVYEFAIDTEEILENPPAPLAEPSPTDTLETIDWDGIRTRPPSEPFSFSYPATSKPVEDSQNLDHVTARPAENEEGDRVRIDLAPGADLEQFAETTRMMLDIGTELTVNADVDGRSVTFQGGTVQSQAAVVGALPADSPAVLIARGNSESTAEQLASSWTLKNLS